jgi:hypothetical protein
MALARGMRALASLGGATARQLGTTGPCALHVALDTGSSPCAWRTDTRNLGPENDGTCPLEPLAAVLGSYIYIIHRLCLSEGAPRIFTRD